MGKLQIKRGLAENLPVEAESGELLFTTDTKKFYIGNGTGNALTEFANAAQLANYLAQKAAKEHTHTSVEITDFDTSVDNRIALQKGQANGIATLDTTGKIPNAQIPNTFKEAAVVWLKIVIFVLVLNKTRLTTVTPTLFYSAKPSLSESLHYILFALQFNHFVRQFFYAEKTRHAGNCFTTF